MEPLRAGCSGPMDAVLSPKQKKSQSRILFMFVDLHVLHAPLQMCNHKTVS